jgi:hypothetical protein
MRKKIVKYGANYIEVDVPDYANGETLSSECVVIEPAYEKLKEPKMTFIDKIVNFFDEYIKRHVS